MLGLSVDERTGDIMVDWSHIHSGYEIEESELGEIQEALENA